MHRMTMPGLDRLVASMRSRDWFGVAIEILAVVLGVMLGLQAAQWTQARQERAYREQIVGALGAALEEFMVHGREIEQSMLENVAKFERAREAGRRVPPAYYREPGGERPPTRAWDAVMATGAARSIEPRLFLRLAMFFDRADSFGERYVRYNNMTEQQVLPYLDQPSHFYDTGGRLEPAYAGYVERLRDLGVASGGIADDAATLKQELDSSQ